MPRMSREKRLEWSFCLNHRNRIAYNALCRSCTHDCKQSSRAIVVLCPRYWSKRWKPPDGGPKQTPIHGKGYPETGQPQRETPSRFTTGSPAGRGGTIRSTPHPRQRAAVFQRTPRAEERGIVFHDSPDAYRETRTKEREPMADNRKYYYLKLKESFFDGDSIVLLESMPDGILFSNILMKLYLKSLKNGGKLQLDEHIPYTAQMIATLTRHQIGTVERAIKVFLQLGLVEQLDGGLLYMTDIELMIGQSSTEGERKRAARRENRALLPQRTNVGHLSDIRPPEIEKEIEIELEKEREREEGQSAPAVFGKYQNVFLTDTELAELKEEIPEKWEYYIDRLSGYIASTGKKYQNHAATILRWAADDTAKAAPKQGIPDYTYKEGESL